MKYNELEFEMGILRPCLCYCHYLLRDDEPTTTICDYRISNQTRQDKTRRHGTTRHKTAQDNSRRENTTKCSRTKCNTTQHNTTHAALHYTIYHKTREDKTRQHKSKQDNIITKKKGGRPLQVRPLPNAYLQ